MKEILKAPKEIVENLSAIEKFVFVLNELQNDNVVKTFSNKINERISKIKESVNAMSGECDRIASKVGTAPRRRFDIMRPDGSIEIGLFGESEKWLRDEFKITGEDGIQILREIDEYGFIVKESEPHYPASKFVNRMENDAKETKKFLDKLTGNDAKNSGVDKKPKKTSKKSKKASKK